MVSDGCGEFAYTLLDYGRKMRADRADPRIRISGELVRQALGVGPFHELAHDKLTIHAVNGTWIYRIGRYVAEWDYYEAEWPD